MSIAIIKEKANFCWEGFNIFNQAHPTMWVVYTIILTLVTSKLVDMILYRAEHKNLDKHPFINQVVKYIRKPTKFMIWLVGLTLALESLLPDTYVIFQKISTIRAVGIVLILSLFFLHLVKLYEKHLYKKAQSEETKIDIMTADAISKVLKIVVVIVSILVLMQSLGLQIGGLIALGGAGGIGISLAAKDLLSNFFGAIMIYTDKPFKVGDCIQSPDREIAGTVEEIGWRLTKIRTFEKMALFVPNSVFNLISVESYTQMTHRRIRQTLKIRYCDIKKIDQITQSIRKRLIERPDIDDSQTMLVNLEKFDDYGIEILIYTFTVTNKWAEYYEVKQSVMNDIEGIIESFGAQIALPRGDLMRCADKLKSSFASKDADNKTKKGDDKKS